MNNQNHNHNHIAVFAFPYGSHGTPLLNTTRQLASLAPQNKVHFSFISTPNTITSLFPNGSKTDAEYPNIKAYQVWDGKPEGYVFSGNHLEEIDLFLKESARPGALTKVLEEAEDDIGFKVSCVMGDAFLWFLGDLAKDVDVPWVSCWVSGEHSLSLHL